MTNRKSTIGFPTGYRWSAYVTLSPMEHASRGLSAIAQKLSYLLVLVIVGDCSSLKLVIVITSQRMLMNMLNCINAVWYCSRIATYRITDAHTNTHKHKL